MKKCNSYSLERPQRVAQVVSATGGESSDVEQNGTQVQVSGAGSAQVRAPQERLLLHQLLQLAHPLRQTASQAFNLCALCAFQVRG